MNKMLPKDLKEKYGITIRAAAKILGVSEDCLYIRNFRKKFMKVSEISFLEKNLVQNIKDQGKE